MNSSWVIWVQLKGQPRRYRAIREVLCELQPANWAAVCKVKWCSQLMWTRQASHAANCYWNVNRWNFWTKWKLSESLKLMKELYPALIQYSFWMRSRKPKSNLIQTIYRMDTTFPTKHSKQWLKNRTFLLWALVSGTTTLSTSLNRSAHCTELKDGSRNLKRCVKDSSFGFRACTSPACRRSSSLEINPKALLSQDNTSYRCSCSRFVCALTCWSALNSPFSPKTSCFSWSLSKSQHHFTFP